MRKSMLVLSGFWLLWSSALAQKPVALKALMLFNDKQPETYSLFNEPIEAKEDIGQYVDHAFTFSIRSDVFTRLKNQDQGLIRLVIPAQDEVQLDLYRVDVFSNTARIRTSDGQEFTPDADHHFYRGMIHGQPNSLAIVSVFENRIQILFSNQDGNKRIQQHIDGQYILFSDKDIRVPNQMNCFTEDHESSNPIHSQDHSTGRQMTGNCVEVYVECDYASYQSNGSSVPNTEEWVAELWNEVITLYENEDIPVAVSDVFVYTSTDPFAAFNNTGDILDEFIDHIDTLTYDGRLAHLLSTRSLGGGIAVVDVLCATSGQCAFSSSLSTSIIPFPTYSWSVEVVTHEMGHNMGSRHTHACVWNGNNTAIDGCGPTAGYSEGCTAPLPVSGTIMSYCHLVGGVGINFNNGFGPQPGDLIRSEYNNASCNTGTCFPPLCTSLTLPVPGGTNVDINQDLFWSSAAGAEGYRLTIGTSPTNADILDNVDVGLVTTYNPVNPFPFVTTIYVKIVPYNILGDAVGCVNQFFITEANVPPLCTQVIDPMDGDTGVWVDAIIHWAHSVGNQTGYKISIGTTLNGTQIANLVNVGNVTSYDHPTSFPYATTLYVKITPYWAGGDINGCASQSFTTFQPIAGDFCSTAISLPCGASLSGSTELALPDPGTPNCGAQIEAPGVWYTFVGNGQNTIIATCSQYDYDTQLNAYSGSCGNLTCVTGIDDFCYTGSLISFPTTNGTTYYVFVQGWGGQQGTYTLTRECYSGPFYCMSAGRDPNSEWISNVTFAGVSNPSGSTSYSDFMDTPITVSRGASYPFQITPSFIQGTRNEYYRIWMDFNHDGDFTDGGEQVFSTGPTSQPVSGNILIPITATKDTTRMRVSMNHNGLPTPCSVFNQGEVEDYMLNIRCNLVTSALDDAGNGTLRNVSTCVDNGENILFATSLNGQTINISGSQMEVSGQWKWMATAGSNIEVKANGINRILRVPVGKSAEIQNLKLTGGTAANGSAIDNLGTLILRNCMVFRPPGMTGNLIRNTGTCTLIGACNIEF